MNTTSSLVVFIGREILMKILIIRAGALGDTLMLMPCINALKKQYEVTVVGRNPGIFFLAPYVNECIDMERGGWHKLFGSEKDIKLSLPYADHVIAFINDSDNSVSSNLKKIFPGAKINLFPPFPEEGSDIHVALYMLHAVNSAGLYIDCKVQFHEACSKPLMKKTQAEGNTVLLHPGSGSAKKNYLKSFWFELASVIKKQCPDSSNISFLLGPAEENILENFKEKALGLGAGIHMCPDKNELPDILSRSCLYIGHDSGVTHLAAMLGISTVALFKSSSIVNWRPLGPRAKIIEGNEDIKDIYGKIIAEVRLAFN